LAVIARAFTDKYIDANGNHMHTLGRERQQTNVKLIFVLYKLFIQKTKHFQSLSYVRAK
jgi:hypothetical protein